MSEMRYIKKKNILKIFLQSWFIFNIKFYYNCKIIIVKAGKYGSGQITFSYTLLVCGSE